MNETVTLDLVEMLHTHKLTISFWLRAEVNQYGTQILVNKTSTKLQK